MLSEEQESLISRYDDPFLTDSERSTLEALLAAESQAATHLAQYQKLDDQLAEMASPSGAVDYDRFRQEVNDRLDRLPVRTGPRLIWRVLVPLSAAAVFLFVALPWLPFYGKPVIDVRPGGPVTPSATVPRMVQVQTTPQVAEVEPVIHIAIVQQEIQLDMEADIPDNRIICFATCLPESDSVEGARQPIIEELYL